MKRWQKVAPWVIAWALGTYVLFSWLRAHEEPQGQPVTGLLVASAAVAAVMTLAAAWTVHSKSKPRARV